MPLSNPRTIYGVHEVVIYHRSTGLPYGTLRVVGGSSLALTGELVNLMGGSSPYSWDAQDGNITGEMSLKPKEYPDFLFQVMLGAVPVELTDDPGNTSALTNVLNASLQDAATGIASVGVKSGSESDLKFGKYIVVAVSPTTVDVYALSSVDFLRGVNDGEYIDDTLKITSTPLTITGTGGVTELPKFGVEFIGGSGVVAMTPGDTAEFEINPPSTQQMDAKIGELGSCIPEFGAIVTAQKKGDGSMWLFDCFRVKALGLPFNMDEKAFSEAEITATLLFDSAKNGIINARYIKPASGCA